MKTFNMHIAYDKARPWQEQITEICDSLRSRGLYPQGFDRDQNNFIIGGMVACTCGDKFDKAYCDGENNCNPNS